MLNLPRFWSKNRTFSALKSTVILVDRYLNIFIAFWVPIVALVVFVHAPLLLCSTFYILRAGLKCAILETGRNTTFGALLGSLGATNISGFVATALLTRHIEFPPGGAQLTFDA